MPYDDDTQAITAEYPVYEAMLDDSVKPILGGVIEGDG